MALLFLAALLFFHTGASVFLIAAVPALFFAIIAATAGVLITFESLHKRFAKRGQEVLEESRPATREQLRRQTAL